MPNPRKVLYLNPASAIRYLSSATRHPASAIRHLPSVIRYQPAVVRHLPSVISHLSSAIGHPVPTRGVLHLFSAWTETISGRITLSPAWNPLRWRTATVLLRAGSSVGTVATARWRRGSKA